MASSYFENLVISSKSPIDSEPTQNNYFSIFFWFSRNSVFVRKESTVWNIQKHTFAEKSSLFYSEQLTHTINLSYTQKSLHNPSGESIFHPLLSHFHDLSRSTMHLITSTTSFCSFPQSKYDFYRFHLLFLPRLSQPKNAVARSHLLLPVYLAFTLHSAVESNDLCILRRVLCNLMRVLGQVSRLLLFEQPFKRVFRICSKVKDNVFGCSRVVSN